MTRGQSRGIASAVVAIWAIFALAVAFLDWRSASILYYVINATGIAGFATGVAWLRYGGRWAYVCLVVSVAFLVLTAAQWMIQIVDLHSANPDGGIPAALLRLVETWGILFTWRRDKFGVGWALLAIYWDVLVVILQSVVVAVLITELRKPPARSVTA